MHRGDVEEDPLQPHDRACLVVSDLGVVSQPDDAAIGADSSITHLVIRAQGGDPDAPLPTAPVPEYATGCDFDYGENLQCIPWTFPKELTTAQERIYLGILLATTISAVLLIAPSAYHRINFRKQQVTAPSALANTVW